MAHQVPPVGSLVALSDGTEEVYGEVTSTDGRAGWLTVSYEGTEREMPHKERAEPGETYWYATDQPDEGEDEGEDEDGDGFECPECDEEFDSAAARNGHLSSHS